MGPGLKAAIEVVIPNTHEVVFTQLPPLNNSISSPQCVNLNLQGD